MNARLTIYSGPHCPACTQAKQWLSQRGASFNEVDVSNNLPLIRSLEQTTGQRTIPQFFYDGRWLPGGFSQVQALHRAGQL